MDLPSPGPAHTHIYTQIHMHGLDGQPRKRGRSQFPWTRPREYRWPCAHGSGTVWPTTGVYIIPGGFQVHPGPGPPGEPTHGLLSPLRTGWPTRPIADQYGPGLQFPWTPVPRPGFPSLDRYTLAHCHHLFTISPSPPPRPSRYYDSPPREWGGGGVFRPQRYKSENCHYPSAGFFGG